ncbi:MAG: OmpA family protein [Bacteroidota bacterium]|nr:OmpA family protein [Bacteroidota bacterium]
MIVTRYIYIVLFFLSYIGIAQVDTLAIKHMNEGTLKKLGKNAMLQKDYNTAIPYFEQFLKLKKNDGAVEFKLAECYRETRNYKKAEVMYAKAYKSDPEKNKTALYYHGQMLKSNGEYDKAQEEFKKFKKEYKGSDKALKKAAAHEAEYCDSAKMILTLDKKTIVMHLDTTINKVHVESSPVSLDENTLLFSSLRTNKREYAIEGDTNNLLVRKFYTAKKTNDEWKFEGEWNESFNVPGENVGNATFTPDGKKMYFSRCKPDWTGNMICAIYMSENANGTWSEPVKLDKKINNPKFNSTQPAVAIDPAKGNEVVYFVSNRKEKSKGGTDIWYFVYDKKKKAYKEPKNAGAKVNTPKDELSPYFDNSTRTLYFSSEGLPGLGGFDVFKSHVEGSSITLVENIGKPVNSGADDIFYTISKNREEGFFVSNREGGNAIKNKTCCDDIYSYKHTQYIHISIEGTVADVTDSINKKMLEDATVELYRVNKTTGEKTLINSVSTNKQGKYDLILEADKDYFIAVKKDGFLNNSGNEISTHEISSSKTLKQDFTVASLPKEPIRIKNIEYEFDRSELLPNSKIVIDTTILPLLLANPQIIVELSSHTDNKGADTYNQKLSQKRAESVVNYLITKGIDKKRLQAVGYGESKPIAPNEKPDGSDDPEGRQHNRRTEFRIIGNLDVEVINEDDH